MVLGKVNFIVSSSLPVLYHRSVLPATSLTSNPSDVNARPVDVIPVTGMTAVPEESLLRERAEVFQDPPGAVAPQGVPGHMALDLVPHEPVHPGAQAHMFTAEPSVLLHIPADVLDLGQGHTVLSSRFPRFHLRPALPQSGSQILFSFLLQQSHPLCLPPGGACRKTKASPQ